MVFPSGFFLYATWQMKCKCVINIKTGKQILSGKYKVVWGKNGLGSLTSTTIYPPICKTYKQDLGGGGRAHLQEVLFVQNPMEKVESIPKVGIATTSVSLPKLPSPCCCHVLKLEHL